ncbi:MAG: uracil-DNA glycosylase [Burkholderiales bacterium]|nr:uracil-DNA glycosylase [Burkholderiales bacterium]MBK8667180.1 uracil-DNA glycosylase [Burkholderiales bacterium]
MRADDLVAAFDSVPNAWRKVLRRWTPEAQSRVTSAVLRASGSRLIGPADPFRALRFMAPHEARVVVFGQDPYPTPNQADGLAFSAERSTRPSLRRIFEVLETDRAGWRRPVSGRLDAWAQQGVLLLNPALSVELGRKESHLDVGWQVLTADIVCVLLAQPNPPVFLLWGSKAQTFFHSACGQQSGRVKVLSTRHPSNDFKRQFMADGSHFAATSDRVNWWCLGE